MDKNVLQRIKKCLELSKSANEHEANQALRMAQKLMAKHGVSDLDVEHATMGKTAARETVPKTLPVYIVALTNGIAKAFGVIPVFSFDHFEFYGESSRTELAEYAFCFVYRSVRNARDEYINGLHKNNKPFTKRKKGDAFALGYVAAVINNLHEMDLTPEYRESVNSFITKHTGSLTKASTQDLGKSLKDRHKHTSNGHNAGSKLSLSTPIKGQSKQSLLR